MALCVLSASSVPRIYYRSSSTKPVGVARRASRPETLAPHRLELRGRSSVRRLNAAGLSEIEPDLNEDPVDRWATNSVDEEDFKYGEYDGHHTYHEGEEKDESSCPINFLLMLADLRSRNFLGSNCGRYCCSRTANRLSGAHLVAFPSSGRCRNVLRCSGRVLVHWSGSLYCRLLHN